MELWTVGSAIIDTIGPNIIRFRWNGDLTADEVNAAREYTAQLRRELDDGTPVYAYLELGQRIAIKNSARKAIMVLGREKPWFGTAIMGARFEFRVLLELTDNAVRLLTKQDSHTKFVDSQEQALVWFDELTAARREQPTAT